MGCGNGKEKEQGGNKLVIPKYKIIFIGNSAVGKTAIIHSYMMGKFLQNHTVTLGVKNQEKTVQIEGLG